MLTKIAKVLTLVYVFGATVCNAAETSNKVAIVLHGGAGTILKKNMTPELERAYRQTLEQALVAGHKVLSKNGSSVDAVTAAIVIMEDSPLFNAGKGSVFTHRGTNSLDASIMAGGDLSAGAIAGVGRIKNPILLADKVRTHSEHVMMTAEGAEEFAREQQLEFVEPKYYYTERRWKALQKALNQQLDKATSLEHRVPGSDQLDLEVNDFKYGTVGVVALDSKGEIAAGTSTGGRTNKRYGRVGDSPIIGAGNYANSLCGVSATGHGEYFMRAVVTHDICALLEYKGMSIQAAADHLMHKKLKDMGGNGGVIGLDKQGNIMMSFNTPGMYRASIDTQGKMQVKIFND